MTTKKPTTTSEPANKPARLFELRNQVKVPAEVHDSCNAEVVGYEWGPDNVRGRKSGPSWIYHLKFEDGGEWWLATEEELIRWQM